MTSIKYITLIILILVSTATISDAGWLIYHEPELKGTILDIDTKQPIEGAVVVVEYRKAAVGLGAGTVSSSLDVRETLTDKEGTFHITSYTTLIQPFSWQIPNSVIIYKPGYASIEIRTTHFTGEILKDDQEYSWLWAKDLKYRIRGRGIIELPEVRTRKERQNARMDADISGAEVNEKELPLLYKLINEERRAGF